MAKRSKNCSNICQKYKIKIRITPNVKQKLASILCYHGKTHLMLTQTYALISIICQADEHHPCLVFNSSWPTCDSLVHSPVPNLHEQTYVGLNCKKKKDHGRVTTFLINDTFASSSDICTVMTGETIF